MKLPYGIGDFKSLIKENYYYVDKTQYFETLEGFSDKFIFFLRPRRFGKSLWISTLQAYYGIEYAKDFESLFGKLYIGKNKTPLANSYYILRFDFSGVDTSSPQKTDAGFALKVEQGLMEFQKRYKLLTNKEYSKITSLDSAANKLATFWGAVNSELDDRKIYVLIDEYDHFANELLAKGLEHFKGAVTQDGVIRKFFEVLKSGTGLGLVNRIFITGIAPITLDSLTSGFNIASNLTLTHQLQTMLGFTQTEVEKLSEAVQKHLRQDGTGNASGSGVDEKIASLLQTWYNGYGFSEQEITNSVYNSDMVLYFFNKYLNARGILNFELADHNVVSDYGKLKGLFSLASYEQSQSILNEIVMNDHSIIASHTQQYSFERPFTRADFVSLLFYLGFLTIEKRHADLFKFRVPNFVIMKLYFENFVYQYLGSMVSDLNEGSIEAAMSELKDYNRPKALLNFAQKALEQLSNRDLVKFDEKYVKCILVTILSLTKAYTIKSEPEINHKYPDLLLIKRPGIETPYQYLFEFKYLHKKDAGQLNTKLAEGRQQIADYKTLPEIAAMTGLKTWLVVFVGWQLVACEAI